MAAPGLGLAPPVQELCFATKSKERSSLGATQNTPAPSPERVCQSRRDAVGSSRGGTAANWVRISWTDQLNRSLLNIYERSEPARRGYMSRLQELWAEEHPDLPSKGSSLATQCRKIRILRKAPQPSKEGAVDPEAASGAKGNGKDRSGINKDTRKVSRIDGPNDSRGRTVLQDRAADEWRTMIEGELQKEYDKIKSATEGRLEGRRKPRCRGIRIDAELLDEVDSTIERMMGESTSLWKLNQLVYAGAVVVERRVKRPPPLPGATLDQRQRKIWHLRRVIGWLQCEADRRRKGKALTPRQRYNLGLLKKIFGDLRSMTKLRATVETQKSLLKLKCMQLSRQKKVNRARLLNSQYKSLGPKSLQGQGKRDDQETTGPSREELVEFWNGVIGETGDYNPEDPRVRNWERSIQKQVPTEESSSNREWETTWETVWNKSLRKARSWKAPGHDGLCAFWWKAFPRAVITLRKLVGRIVDGDEDIPDWLVRGRTVLIPKDGCEGKPEQYRPITCLNTAYKLMTSSLALILQEHSTEYGLIPPEQKALRKGRRGCLDALMVDFMVGQEARLKQRNLSAAWIDYQKAYDRVPHGWLERVLRVCKAPVKVRRCISSLIQKWTSEFSVGCGDSVTRVEMRYRRGLFQGDSLSPLLFCLCLAPLSYGLRRLEGYKCDSLGGKITHQLFMDDLKVYARGEESLDRALTVVDEVSTAIGMKLGLRKCAVAHMVRNRLVKMDYDLPKGRSIKSLEGGEYYKYLGVEQIFKPGLGEVKQRVIKTYLRRLRKIWGSQLNARNKVNATNVWAVSVFRYFFFLKWSVRDLRALDRKTRAILRQCRSHQYGAAVQRLYLPRYMGGRGLQNLWHVREREVVSLVAYLTASDDPLLQAVVKHQLYLQSWGKYSILSEAKRILAQTEMTVTTEGLQHEDQTLQPRRAVGMLKNAQLQQLTKELSRKTIHGQFFNQCREEGWDEPGSHLWLRIGKLSSVSEGVIFAAQDGVIFTKAYQARVLKRQVEQDCRVCGKHPETLGHVLSACEKSQWTLYKARHDRILYQLVLVLSEGYKIPIPESMRWTLTGWSGTGVLEANGVKLKVDLSIPTDRALTERRPDLIAFFSESRRIVIFEVACAWDPLVREREEEKRSKYQELAADMAVQNPGWKVSVVPVVVGVLGSMGKLREELSNTELFTRHQVNRLSREIQYESLCSAIRMIRRLLALPE